MDQEDILITYQAKDGRHMKTFDQSDTIIAKGLANYETLIEYDSGQLPQMVYYLFRAKCPFIAQSASAAINDLVVRVKG